MDNIAAGWYQDPNEEGIQRYHDGSGWTDHTAPIQTAPPETAQTETAQTETAPTETAQTETAPTETAQTETAPIQTAPAETAPAETAPTETAQTETAPGQYEPPASAAEPGSALSGGEEPGSVPPGPSLLGSSGSRRGELAGLAFIGAFVGLIFGGFLFNGVGALTPLTVEPGMVERLEIDISTGSSTSNRSSYELHGVTESGIAWKIVNEDAYRLVDRQGYPQAVTVGIGDWTGTAELVTGQGWEVDHQTTGARVWWGFAIAVAGIGGGVAAVLIGRSKFGLAGGGLFAVCYFVLGGVLGWVAFGWFQSG